MTTMLMIPDSSSNAPNTPDTAYPTAPLLLLVTMPGEMEGLQVVLLLIVMVIILQIDPSTVGLLMVLVCAWCAVVALLLLLVPTVLNVMEDLITISNGITTIHSSEKYYLMMAILVLVLVALKLILYDGSHLHVPTRMNRSKKIWWQILVCDGFIIMFLYTYH